MSVLLTCLFALLLWVVPAFSADYYVVDGVGESCNDTNAGSPAAPWCNAPSMPNWTGSVTLMPNDRVFFENTGTWTYNTVNGQYILRPEGGVQYIGNEWPAVDTDCSNGGCAKFDCNTCGFDVWIHIVEDHPTLETVVKGFDLDGNMTSCGNAVGVLSRINIFDGQNLLGATKRIQDMYIHEIRTEGYACPGNARTAFSYGINVSTGSFTAQGWDVENVEILDNHFFRVCRNGIAIYPSNDTLHADNYARFVTVRNNRLIDIGQCAENYNASAINLKNWVRDTVVENNYIQNPERNGIAANSDQAPHEGCDGCTIRNNIINGAEESHGIFMAGFCNTAGANLSVYNNIITGAQVQGIYVRNDLCAGQPLTVRIYSNSLNNEAIVVDNLTATLGVAEVRNNIASSITISDPGFTSSNNNLGTACYVNTSDFPTGFIGTFGVDMEPNTGGMNIQDPSACKDGGFTLGAPYTLSINSVLRPYDTGYDIGAYERGVIMTSCSPGTCYVRIGGSDANNCTDATINACATVQRAVNVANCGDIVDVGPGVFGDQRTVVAATCSAGSPLVIRGAGVGVTTVDGDTPISSLPGPPTWTLEGGPTYPDNNVYSISLGLGRIGHMRNGATGESFRLISDSCMDGGRQDCWNGSNQDGDWLLNQASNAQFTERDPDINAWAASDIRYGTKANNTTYFRQQNGTNPATVDIRVCASSGDAANTFTVSGNYITLQDMTVIGCRRSVYITGNNNLLADITTRNNKQGLMVDGGTGNTLRRIDSSSLLKWTTYAGEQPLCGWVNQTVATAFRSNCSLHRMENKQVTGESGTRIARVWIVGADNTVVEDSTIYDEGTGIYIFASDNVTIRRNYLHHCSSGCITLAPGFLTGLEIYDNQFHRYNTAIQTSQIQTSGGTWYIYNNRGNETLPFGNAIELRATVASSAPTVTVWIYHNSFSGNQGQHFFSSFIDKFENGGAINNIWDGQFVFGSGVSTTLQNDPDGMRCFGHNWTSGNQGSSWFFPGNVDDGGTPAWDATGDDPFDEATFSTIPASAANAGLDVVSGTWTCRPASSWPALPWNSLAPAPTGTPSMGWQPGAVLPPLTGRVYRGIHLRNRR